MHEMGKLVLNVSWQQHSLSYQHLEEQIGNLHNQQTLMAMRKVLRTRKQVSGKPCLCWYLYLLWQISQSC